MNEKKFDPKKGFIFGSHCRGLSPGFNKLFLDIAQQPFVTSDAWISSEEMDKYAICRTVFSHRIAYNLEDASVKQKPMAIMDVKYFVCNPGELKGKRVPRGISRKKAVYIYPVSDVEIESPDTEFNFVGAYVSNENFFSIEKVQQMGAIDSVSLVFVPDGEYAEDFAGMESIELLRESYHYDDYMS